MLIYILLFSLIHTGHGSHKGKTWGQPGSIDEVYLRNPMQPPDTIGMNLRACATLKRVKYYYKYR
jgi:activated CDC42 kinase 1